MKKIIYQVLLFSIMTLVGVILNTYLKFEDNNTITVDVFSKILLKSSVISLILTCIFFLFNRKKIENL